MTRVIIGLCEHINGELICYRAVFLYIYNSICSRSGGSAGRSSYSYLIFRDLTRYCGNRSYLISTRVKYEVNVIIRIGNGCHNALADINADRTAVQQSRVRWVGSFHHCFSYIDGHCMACTIFINPRCSVGTYIGIIGSCYGHITVITGYGNEACIDSIAICINHRYRSCRRSRNLKVCALALFYSYRAFVVICKY